MKRPSSIIQCVKTISFLFSWSWQLSVESILSLCKQICDCQLVFVKSKILQMELRYHFLNAMIFLFVETSYWAWRWQQRGYRYLFAHCLFRSKNGVFQHCFSPYYGTCIWKTLNWSYINAMSLINLSLILQVEKLCANLTCQWYSR